MCACVWHLHVKLLIGIRLLLFFTSSLASEKAQARRLSASPSASACRPGLGRALKLLRKLKGQTHALVDRLGCSEPQSGSYLLFGLSFTLCFLHRCRFYLLLAWQRTANVLCSLVDSSVQVKSLKSCTASICSGHIRIFALLKCHATGLQIIRKAFFRHKLPLGSVPNQLHLATQRTSS